MIKQFPLIHKKICSPNRSSYRPLSLAVALAFSGIAPSVSNAETYTVMNINDVGDGSLRQAVIDANANAGADTILFNSAIVGSIIVLTSDQLEVSDDLTVTGPTDLDPNSIVIDGNNNSRIFYTNDNLLLENMTLTNGKASQSGGAIYASNGFGTNTSNEILTLNNTIVSNSSTTGDSSGGGIALRFFNGEINNSIITNNSSSGGDDSGPFETGGGGVHLIGNDTFSDASQLSELTINNSIISNNTALINNYGNMANGGGLLVIVKTILNNTIVDNNSSSRNGGGANLSGIIQIENSTFSNNNSASQGGGLLMSSKSGTLNFINNSTFSENVSASGGGISLFSSPRSINNSSIINNTATDGKGGGISSLGTLTLNQSTVSGNSASGSNGIGGGLYNRGNLTIDQSTITKNTGSQSAGGVHQTNIYTAYGIYFTN